MNEHFEPTRFTRNNRVIHALMLESQAWFSVNELGRMMGLHLDERLLHKLGSDQHRFVWLTYHGEAKKTLMVSESGMYALMVYHHIPENRNLRLWLTHEVIPALRSASTTSLGQGPSFSALQWAERSVSVLNWQNEAWVKWRDMTVLMPSVEQASVSSMK